MEATGKLEFLRDLWDPKQADLMGRDELMLLRYRSNLLGADLRITNFGGGNTSAKFSMPDPFTGTDVRVLAVKGSGGDLGSISESGFALLYLDRLEQLKNIYKGETFEDEMVSYYPLSAFGNNRVAASIDVPLHAFLPFAHVDHLHPDWAIALAASANGREKLEEFNRDFGRCVAWLPWQRPGFELAIQLERVVRETKGCDGVLLGSHGLFTWGESQRQCYWNSVRTIDQMGIFIARHQTRRPPMSASLEKNASERREIAAAVFPTLRGIVSSNRRVIGHYDDSGDALRFAGSNSAAELASLGTSCPDHFLRTRICPMFVDWKAEEDLNTLQALLLERAEIYRREYEAYYREWATADSPALRDANPSIVIVPSLGLFGFGKSKREARITTEFFLNAVRVMAGANALEGDKPWEREYPQARNAEQSKQFKSFHNYVALPRSEAFRIEYWALEEAKLQRMPVEAEFSRKVALVVGGGSGVGRETAILLAARGAHVVVADQNAEAAKSVASEIGETAVHTCIDLSSAATITRAAQFTALEFGGIDIIINTAAIFPVVGPDGELTESQWNKTLSVNITGNYFLAKELSPMLKQQRLPVALVLTSSANAVVPKHGSEAYDISKTAVNHLIRELAVGLAPLIRVNGIAPATVVAGSTMFPRDRVISSLSKYNIDFSEGETTEELRGKLAEFYARRTLTQQPIAPTDCAEAIIWLASERSAKTTGHVIPVDGGLHEAFLR